MMNHMGFVGAVSCCLGGVWGSGFWFGYEWRRWVGVGGVLGSDMGGGGGGGCGWGVTDGLVEQSPSTVSSNLPFERATSRSKTIYRDQRYSSNLTFDT